MRCLPLIFSIVMLAFVLLFGPWTNVSASSDWPGVARDINSLLDEGREVYASGKVQKARELINKAYFGPFEGEGMETAIRLNISARRAAEIEYNFSELKRLMQGGASLEEVDSVKSELVAMLEEDAALLGSDRSGQTPMGSFVSSLFIVLREGIEAILVIGAIIAYLVKSGNSDRIRVIYQSTGWALAASVLTAWLLNSVINLGGADQELVEGATMLMATAVLFLVSYWVISKAEADRWQRYIAGKVEQSLNARSSFALGSAAFLAVYREGAETVLFYQALISGAPGQMGMILTGLALGLALLLGIFALVRYGSVRLPIRPFFLATGALMYYMAFVFAGGGVKELQEAGAVGMTPIPGVPIVAWLGIYPTWETMGLQSMLVLAAFFGLVFQFKRRKATGE